MKRVNKILFFAFIALLYSCEGSTGFDKIAGSKLDAARDSVGLQRIPDWEYVREANMYVFKHPALNEELGKGKSFFGKKIITINDGEVYSEADYYYSSQKGYTNKGTEDEIYDYGSLRVKYLHQQDRWGVIDTDCCDSCPPISIYNMQDLRKLENLWNIEFPENLDSSG